LTRKLEGGDDDNDDAAAAADDDDNNILFERCCLVEITAYSFVIKIQKDQKLRHEFQRNIMTVGITGLTLTIRMITIMVLIQ
jgi:hypothetical protein